MYSINDLILKRVEHSTSSITLNVNFWVFVILSLHLSQSLKILDYVAFRVVLQDLLY